jgi:hypothetical protein
VSPVLVKNEETGVSLIKIYLIKKVQLEYLVKVESQTEFNIDLKDGEIIQVPDSQSIYNSIVSVGELDQLPIYIMTNNEALNDVSKAELGSPSIECMKAMYNGLKETFISYTEHLAGRSSVGMS